MTNFPIYNNTNDNKPSSFDIFLKGFGAGFGIGITLLFVIIQLFG